MQLKRIILLAVITAATLAAKSQVANYALSLTEDASVNCGPMAGITDASSYTVQMWLCPEKWTPNATLAGRGNSLSLNLGQSEGKLNFTVGEKTMEIASADLKNGAWSQVTIVCDNGAAKAFVNGKAAGTGNLAAVPASNDNFLLGGKYAGRIDEVRIWKAALAEDFNRFINNTLNIYAPQWDDLVAYYKMDQNQCQNLVDYVSIEKPEAATNNHGIFSTGATRTLVTDNTGLPYLINGAYTANERFYDRAIPREQYLLSNDLIILGVEFVQDEDGNLDGHVQTCTPNNHAKPTGGVSYMQECAGRTGVASFDGTGLLTAPSRTLTPNVINGTANFTFETWVYIDEWVKGAYLFRKETADGKQGFSIRLGEEGEIYVRCNESEYGAKLSMKTKQWHHLGIVPRNTGVKRTNFLFVIDGEGKSATNTLCNGGLDCVPTGVKNVEAKLGENFKGKLDETVMWDMSFDAAAIKQHSQNVVMPGFNKVLTSDHMQKANTCYLFDNADDLGFSSYSQDNWRDIMMAAYDGYRGAQVRISVKSANGWQNCIANAQRRKNFAQDLGEIAKGYHGVELDLEWMDGKQTNIGLLAREIRACLPEGKTFFVSCHAYGAYLFPLEDMPYVDGFTFQQYGPETTYFQWNHYLSSIKNFRNYGFANDKIMTSYATTTSRGSQGNNVKEIIGVKDGCFDGADFTPQTNTAVVNGYSFVFTGPAQCYDRAAYCVENQLQGIFYWDMGNDLPVDHKYNLAKWASYGLNANVDRDVKNVEVKHGSNSLQNVLTDREESQISVKVEGNQATVKGVSAQSDVEIYGVSGKSHGRQEVRNGKFDISVLTAGMYIALFTMADGRTATAKFIKK